MQHIFLCVVTKFWKSVDTISVYKRFYLVTFSFSSLCVFGEIPQKSRDFKRFRQFLSIFTLLNEIDSNNKKQFPEIRPIV